MTKPEDIGWGSYKQYEGAIFRGTRKYQMPKFPSENAVILGVVTATEGGCGDAINAYDRCIISVGYIQLCEAAYHLTSGLLGALATKNPALLDPLQPALDASNAVFRKNAAGKWRFAFKGANGSLNEVDTADEQKRLFLLNSNGLKGTWDAPSKAHVKLWAASMANTLAQPEADAVQIDYVANRLHSFAMPYAKRVLFDEPRPSDGWVGVVRAAYLSFAANLPAVASEQLKIAIESSKSRPWSKGWTIDILRQLTFGPNIAIYPHRYEAIRPVLERCYSVDLPDFSKDLKAWKATMDEEGKPKPKEPTFMKVQEVQQLLLDLGYDLGPSGADGRMGSKTKDALMTFQGLNGLNPDGILGPKTRGELLDAWKMVYRSV